MCTDCERARKRRWREGNPIQASFGNLKTNAKTRGIKFFLTFEEFAKFVVDTEYILRKGQRADDLTIDRIRPELGYRAGNLQVLTLSQNVKKYKAGECWPLNKESKEDADTPF